MPISHDDALRSKFSVLELEKQRALADYEEARLADNEYGVAYASDTLLEIQNKLDALHRIGSNYVLAQQTQQQGNRYGLSADEVAIANGIAGNDPHMSNDQRQQLYLQQKQKLNFMRATGQYRDDQGTVKR